MSLTVFVTERLSPGLRGVISKWLVEVNPGVYVGTLSARVRSEVADEVASWVLAKELGYALMIYPTNSEQGYAMEAWGTSRYGIVDLDGLALVSEQHAISQFRPEVEEIDPGW